MGFIDTLKERAKANVKTIVLPETEDKRTLAATEMLFWLVAKKQSKKAVKDWIFPVQRS